MENFIFYNPWVNTCHKWFSGKCSGKLFKTQLFLSFMVNRQANFRLSYYRAYLELPLKSKMECFARIVNKFYLLTIVATFSVLDVRGDPGHSSVLFLSTGDQTVQISDNEHCLKYCNIT